jgi:hypothetical protein
MFPVVRDVRDICEELRYQWDAKWIAREQGHGRYFTRCYSDVKLPYADTDGVFVDGISVLGFSHLPSLLKIPSFKPFLPHVPLSF